MREIILKYLNKNYRLTFATFDNFLVKDRINGEDVKLSAVMQSLNVIFDIDENEMLHIFDDWCDYQNTLLNNRLVEIQEKLYAAGVTIELTPQQKDKLTEVDLGLDDIFDNRIV